MSKLEELIKKLCPNGVEYYTIGEIANYRRGSFPQPYTNSAFYGGDGAMPFVQVADIENNGFKLKDYTKQTISKIAQPKSIFVSQGTVICSIQGTIGRVAITQYDAYVDRTIAIFEEYKININKKFFAYCIQLKFGIEKNFARGSTLKTITKEEYTKFKIPVPPIEVQNEIVRILDNFTELEAELETELETRKKQYEYYRDEVFKFKGSVKKVKLDDVIISLKTGLNPRKFFILNTEDANGYYVTVKELGNRQVKYWESKDKVNQEGLNRINERSNLEINDVLFSGTGTIGRVSIIEQKPDNWNVKEGVYILKPNTNKINPVYLMYLMQSNYIINIYSKFIVGSPVASVPMKDLKNIEFDLPNIEEQKRIVSILDRFDKLCNDISEGLPAEIEARRKQYEYYRDKLLDFKELKVENKE